MYISAKKPNLILIVSDTLRADYIGCYGNKKIHTANLDAFAAESVVFDHAYPESLPTIPFRRSLHTGRRSYPFRNYKPLRGETVLLPGWQPLSNDEDTLTENLVKAGYYTGFVSDAHVNCRPGMNFARGFDQWEFIRGQAGDNWQSPATVSTKDLRKYGNPEQLKSRFPKGEILRLIANSRHIRSEDETTTAKVFKWAMDFIDDNRHVQPFYLMIDCFDPHEAWEASESYLELYANPNYKGRTIPYVKYGPAKKEYTAEEIEHIKAHYSGLVTLVDNWFGHFIDKLKRLGLWERSMIAFISDHGTNFADNPEHIIGKPHYALYPGVMHIPLIIHFPGGEGADKRFNQLVYNVDLTATFYDCGNVSDKPEIELDGQSLYLLMGKNRYKEREYVTSRFGNTAWYRDKKYWVIMEVDSKPRAVFDLDEDPRCQHNIVSSSTNVVKKAWQCILYDADDDLPVYKKVRSSDAVGRREKNSRV